MKVIYGLLFLSLLSGCASNEEPLLVTQKNVTIIPDQSMYQCGDVTKFPDNNTLTDIQVASFVAEVYREYMRCHNSLYAVRDFLYKAKVSSEATRQ
jgi:ABC-type microcin C transport system permease subunit YejE